MEIHQHRREYPGEALREEEMDADPVRQFRRWFQEALDSQLVDPTAMALATADEEGQPSVRVVLLKGFDERGLVFFTDHRSRKGCDLSENPRASALFYWPPLNRQVVVRGTASQVSREESETYFQTRPYRSQLAAWASRQSAPLGSREDLDQQVARMEQTYAEGSVPLPLHWGGYRISPAEFEFWQGRPDRLHDRFLYTRVKQAWRLQRLSP